MLPTTRTWGMMTCVILLACSGDYLVGNTYSYSVTSSIDLLQWAPLRLKVKPYLTFLNQYYQPTWRTRHPNTLERESLRHLRLPRGAPFALACGACFQTSRLEANLTMEVLPSREYYYRPKMNGRGQIRKYTVNRLTCLLSYLQINPLHDPGRIVCSLNRGRHTHTDTITFSLLEDVAIVEERVEEAEENAERIEKTDEKLEKDEKTDEKFENNVGEAEKKPDGRADDVVSRVVPYAGGKRTTELHCPSPKESWASSLVWSATNPLVYVWYFDPNPGNVVIPKLQPVITLPTPKYTQHVTCTVYNMGRAGTMHRTHYTIMGTHTTTTTASQQQQQQQQQNYYDNDNTELSTTTTTTQSLPTTIIGIVSAAVVVAVIIIFMGIYHFCTSASRK